MLFAVLYFNMEMLTYCVARVLIQNIIVFRCVDNTQLKEVNSVQLNNGISVINYNPTTSLLWYASTNSDELIKLCT